MNTKISIKNFRIFKDYVDFELKPITILTGTNSSGKSSFIKALKLLQNNIDSCKKTPSNFDKLEFNNQDLYSLGGFSKIISKYSQKKEIYFKINFKNDLFGELYSELVFEQNTSSKMDEGIIKRHTIYKDDEIIVEIKYNEDKGGLEKKYHNKDFWIDAFFELLYRKSHYEIVEDICHKLFFGKALNNKEKLVVEELSKKGYFYRSPKPETHRNDRQYGSFLKNDIENYISEGKKDLTKILKAKNVFFVFDFYYKIARFKLENFKNIDFNSLDDEDKEDVYQLTNEFISNGIYTKKELEDIINEITINYIKNNLLKGNGINKDPMIENYSRKLGVFPKLKDKLLTFTENGIEEVTPFHEFKINNEFIAEKLKEENRDNKYVNDVADLLKNLIDDVTEQSYKTFYNIKTFPFIGADRSDLQRIFLYNNESKFMQILNKFLAFDKTEIEKKLFFVNKWLKEFEIADELIINSDTDGAGIKIFLSNNNEKTLLSDVGYGINMLIPLIISLVSYENSYVFIEEPEANLHPSLQSKLASLFVDAFNQFGTMSVIETHSEYLIRKFQILIADKKINIKPNDINIYYLYHPEKKPKNSEQIYLMKIRDDGIMENSFGKGFFDESGNLGMELLNLINMN
ncbi:MAG: DUF3696 domain-containing protein [Flavobacteriaceae bacterium]|nr:DUF3696 domain-containing protein [Flavobacteriaceae bacterium]